MREAKVKQVLSIMENKKKIMGIVVTGRGIR